MNERSGTLSIPKLFQAAKEVPISVNKKCLANRFSVLIDTLIGSYLNRLATQNFRRGVNNNFGIVSVPDRFFPGACSRGAYTGSDKALRRNDSIDRTQIQGVVTFIRPVEPSATEIKIESIDQEAI